MDIEYLDEIRNNTFVVRIPNLDLQSLFVILVMYALRDMYFLRVHDYDVNLQR